MKKTNDFTEGRILPKLLGFAFPVLLALFLQAMYGAVDLLVVGQFSSAAAVSAVHRQPDHAERHDGDHGNRHGHHSACRTEDR